MNRRAFLKLAGSAAAMAVLPRFALGAGKPSRKLNFVFILADDLGWSDLGCFGSDLHETPNIDRLALQSERFTDAYAAASVCSPTRASILTGKYPARLHITTWYEASANPPLNHRLIPPVTVGNLPHKQVTIAEVLKKAGYLTAHVGKWHLGDAEHYPETQGFDINIGGTYSGAPNTYFYPYSGTGAFGDDKFRYVPHLELGKDGEYLTDRLTDEALKIVDAVKDGPFYLNMDYHTVHTPIEGKEELIEYYRKKIKPDMRHRNPVYAAMVHTLDENVGRLLARLDKLGIAERTVVFFFSDNGGLAGRYRGKTVTDNHPLRSGKGSLYEGGTRVPLIVRWPGVTKAGSICSQPVSSIDFYPTILEMAGLSGDPQHNADMDGISFVSLLKDPGARLKRDTLYWHWPHYYFVNPRIGPASSIRQGDWKLIEYFEDNHVELYNLAEDIGEKDNLAEKMPKKAEHLRKLLHSWRKAVDAQMPTPNPRYKSRAGK